jgi:hypothetical protein
MPPLKAPAERLEPGDILARVPGIKGFVRRPPAADAESVERLYQRFEAAERQRLTWRRMLTEGRRDEAAAYLADHRAAIASVATREETGGAEGRLRTLRATMQTARKASRAPGRQAALDRAVQVTRRVLASTN